MNIERVNTLLRRCVERNGWINFVPGTKVLGDTLPLLAQRNNWSPADGRRLSYDEEKHNRWSPPYVDLKRLAVDVDCLSLTDTANAVHALLNDRRFRLSPVGFTFNADFYGSTSGLFQIEFELEGDPVPGVVTYSQEKFLKYEIIDLLAPPGSIERLALDGLANEDYHNFNLASYQDAMAHWSNWRKRLNGFLNRESVEDVVARHRAALAQNAVRYEQAIA